jgi:hypothetical protein
MSRTWIVQVIVSAGLALALSACNRGGTPTEPDIPDFPLLTKTFSGTVTPGGAVAFNFTVTNPGAINATIATMSPISSLTMGLTIGSWDATNQSCPQQVFSDAARVSQTLSGTPQSAGEYCVGIYDVGNLQQPSEFSLTVTHY